MSPTDVRTKQSIAALTITVVIALLWTVMPHPILIVAVCFAPLALLFVLNQTFWLVTLFVIFSFFRIHEAFPAIYSFKIPLLLSLGALAALAFHLLLSRQLTAFWHPSLKWLCIFWGLVIIGIVFASSRDIAITVFKNTYWKIIVMTLAITWLITKPQQLAQMSKAIIVAGMLIGLVALNNAANGIDLVEGTRVSIGRSIGSVLGDPNDLALVLMFPLAFTVSKLMEKRSPTLLRLFALITCFILFFAVIQTQSRGGLLGSLSVFAYFAFKHIKSKTLVLVLGAVAALALYAFAGISGRESGGAAEDGIDASAMGRLYAWEAAFKMALHHPFTGVGLDNFYFNYYFYSPHWDGINHAVHSTWFGVLAETGFVGLAVFITLIVSLIRTSLKSISLLTPDSDYALTVGANAVLSGLIGTIVSGTFLTQGFTWPIYILAALTVVVSRIVQSDCQNEKS
ncbi:O-antigen ligase family protein [Vibrio parahaemolyticus]|uniref:O-antigen ligase family protein n=1 Tax=Vibrio parahaemolyticus TaxID=670 RepID=UPI000426EAFF|nr:O-antigen ligase family protein [Vibrio parahaemolyticus]EJG0163225.1 O-antigen ligase family protein [Vibrio parahaemolyticus]EJG0239072.1 O-antigen ligase family protein [Vibrio parahaemolyticus]EJG0253498.1 O-antigen ligase family protein [Vibrio parahaemolyticus]EJG0363057.1 O-antigen ligase family protein [Vibrio parahaemolyticus]EJG0368035.1 O-antigen ligase family protein [Vibrio parahaemolyticus]